ncbi:MAG TPA: hypothetical protein VGX46_01835 [Vicinamibacterales bacterium]|nr:hypothetical protein [Vicinamibacterales bacterium]
MPDLPDAPAGQLTPPGSTAFRYVAALRLPLLLFCVLAAALFAYYVFYVAQERNYLVTRNFRLLATIGEHIEGAIHNDRTVLSNMRFGTDSLTQVQAQASRFIPILHSAQIVKWPDHDGSQPTEGAMALQFVERNTQVEWVLRDQSRDNAESPWQVRLSLDNLLEPLLRSHVDDGTFDALIVAAPDGRVIFQTGASPLRVAYLGRLPASTDAKATDAGKFDDLARAAGMTDVTLGGNQYTLFAQPCCGLMSTGAPPATTGWVLVGLTSQRSLNAASYAVSFSIMAVISIGLLLALLSWPFVKLLLIGEAQRIKPHDVVLVGTSALLGIAVITISVLDLYAYKTLEATLDDQLQVFAEDIKARANEEIQAAVRQLSRLVTAVDRPGFPGPKFPDLRSISDLGGINPAPATEGVKQPLLNDADLTFYPEFESFSLIDENGEQRQKMTLGSFVTPRISVDDRAYFIHWTTEAPGATAFFEPIQSATTGAREAVVSTRTNPGRVAALSIPMRTLIDPVIVPGFGFVAIDSAGKVLFHSDPLHSLSENFFLESDNNQRLRALVVARHQERVNIRYWGDDQRAFVDPMLIGDQPFTLITFYDKGNVRAVNVDWLVITGTFLLVYTSAYLAACILMLIVFPKYRAPWLWPDPARSKQYLDIVPSLLLLAAAFVVGIAVLPRADLILLAWLVPLLAWVAVYTALKRRHDWQSLTVPSVIGAVILGLLLVVAWRANGPMARVVLMALVAGGVAEAVVAVWRQAQDRPSALAPPVNISYGLAAGLLVVIASVLPAAAFFAVGHGIQIESFIKYSQLQVALSRIEHAKRAHDIIAKQVPDASVERLRRLRAHTEGGAADWGIYQQFFFDTKPLDGAAAESTGCRTPPNANNVERPPVDSTNADTLAETVEELLPFYSESSVHLREMVHARSSDGRWRWHPYETGLALCSPLENFAALQSAVPPFFDSSGTSVWRRPPFAWLIGGLIGVLAIVVWTVRFITDKIFVADVIEPLSTGSSESFGELWAPNLFLVGAAPPAQEIPEDAFCKIDLNDAPADAAARSLWFGEQFGRVEQSPVRQNVLMLHYERRDDGESAEQKLALLERIINTLNRTVVVVSAVPPSVGGATASAGPQDQAQADMKHRWADVLSRFTVIPILPVAPVPAAPSPASLLGGWTGAGWREIVWRVNALGFSHSAKFLEQEQQDPRVDRMWRAVLPYAWHPDRPPLDVGQLLVEVGERAENYYREIWSTCTREEKLVLGQLAEEGLVNYKTKKTLRRLMARGLVRREPHFVLMNETFRRFVLSSFSRTEVAALENDSTASAWDATRRPFLALLVASLAFLFVTQHELFNTTVGVVAAVAAAVPAIMKMANFFGDSRAS